MKKLIDAAIFSAAIVAVGVLAMYFVFGGVEALSGSSEAGYAGWMAPLFFFCAAVTAWGAFWIARYAGEESESGSARVVSVEVLSPKRDDSDKTPEPILAGKWAFVYEEEHFDAAGRNIIGVITNGVNYLFFHAYKADEDDAVEICEVFNSITFDKDSLECSYPWTDENDEVLLDALDKADEDPFVRGSFCGDDGVLRTLKFKPYREE